MPPPRLLRKPSEPSLGLKSSSVPATLVPFGSVAMGRAGLAPPRPWLPAFSHTQRGGRVDALAGLGIFFIGLGVFFAGVGVLWAITLWRDNYLKR